MPIVLDGYKIKKPFVRTISTVDSDKEWLEVVIHEGRKRQVRRMCAAAGLTVLRLIRTGEGNLRLGELPVGKWRNLTEEEIESLSQ